MSRRRGNDKVDQSVTIAGAGSGMVTVVPSSKTTRLPHGRTPDGKDFVVPITHDMVSQLLSPYQPKNLGDLFVVFIVCAHIYFCFLLPKGLRAVVLGCLFLAWRASYNIGIGYLLHVQSCDRRLVRWAHRSGIFDHSKKCGRYVMLLRQFLRSEFEAKIPNGYRFEDAPIEYNTWLLFRRLVDLILMCDFTTYCLFAIASASEPEGEKMGLFLTRWILGLFLISFNLWVKLDAHRVVKDYAWYWGDFFFLVEQDLTFDGVFEMAPHPMYSVGYAGFYGISLLSASYNVLFISILAHAAQFAFLVWVEEPHIEKTYPPATDKNNLPNASKVEAAESNLGSSSQSPLLCVLGLGQINSYRVTNICTLFVLSYLCVATTFTPSTTLYKALFAGQAIFWRLVYTLGVGSILHGESTSKWWTRKYVRVGLGPREAWLEWKELYNFTMLMTYSSFISAALKFHTFSSDHGSGLHILQYVLGIAMITLQLWTSTSIHKSLGDFGWHFGDFFFPSQTQLTYSGIYRFLNNPERVIGLAGIWGIVIITMSPIIFCLALFSHVSSLAFIQYVERPHMQRLHGDKLRSESGLTRSIKRSLPLQIAQISGNVDKFIDEGIEFVEELIQTARPKLAAGVNHFVKDTSRLFQQPSRITITRLEADMAAFDSALYSISIAAGAGASFEMKHGPDRKFLVMDYGSAIQVQWSAPAGHSLKDWIGLYRVAETAQSREVTRISSHGRWIATIADQYDADSASHGIIESQRPGPSATAELITDFHGTVEFSGDKLFWEEGIYEFRYHHNGKHNVMAISQAFEIRVKRFDEDDIDISVPNQLQAQVERQLLKLVQDCFDNNRDMIPMTIVAPFSSRVLKHEKYAQRIVYAIFRMFGVDLASGVVRADGSVTRLAWRICTARHVLAPYSLKSDSGQVSPFVK